MNSERTERNIENILKTFDDYPIQEASTKLLNALGYDSGRTGSDGADKERFDRIIAAALETTNPTDKLCIHDWQDFHIIFQVGDDEINASLNPDQLRLFDSTTNIDDNNSRSYMFVAVSLSGEHYTRTQLADITRFINKDFQKSIMVMFRYSDLLTLSVINRRPDERQTTIPTSQRRQVLEKVTLLKDIQLRVLPKRAHTKILAELHLHRLTEHEDVSNFDTLHDKWNKILDTEPLNREFYGKLFDWYKLVVAECKFPDNANEFQAVRLITRLLFIWFLKEKIEKIELVPSNLFVKEKVQTYLKNFNLETSDYYQAILQNLFFATLNTPMDDRNFGTETNTYHYDDLLNNPDDFLERLKQVPFVNGGLFDCDMVQECFTDDRNDRQKLHVPAKFFFDTKQGIFPLFDHYKFTVEEHTPIEQEVALDPELLGKVFEHLLAEINPDTQKMAESARKQTGSFYTPRAVVDYMIDEALVAALSQRCHPTDGNMELWNERLHYLLDHEQICDDAKEWFDDQETDEIMATISELKILDPAVGSGAFPMGMLQKLTLALRRLDPDNTHWKRLQKKRAVKRTEQAFDSPSKEDRDAQLTEISNIFERYHDSDFGRKLYLIQNSIFGIDIQPVACQIAKLRFFISLVIEQKIDKNAENMGIKPLPNLETRFVTADTLIRLKKQIRLFTTEKALKLYQQLWDNREQHFHATTQQRRHECKQKDKRLREQLVVELRQFGASEGDLDKIAEWDIDDQNASANWFDLKLMFGITDGFDVVIGNPPYSKSANVPKERSEQLKEHYGWSGDLYDYFIFAGFDLVSKQGIFTYIANDSYVTFSTKHKIRDLFLHHRLLHLVKAPANTFEATIYTAIFILLKSKAENTHTYDSGEMILPDFKYRSNGKVKYKTIYQVPDYKFLLSAENIWVLRLFAHEKVEKYCLVLDTGIHSGNVRPKIFFKENNGERHRLLQGRQIQKYLVQWDSPDAQYKFCDINYEPLPIPGIGKGGRPSSKNEYWSCIGIENHHQPERLLMRQTDDDLIVAYHSETELGRFYTDNTLFTILPKSNKTHLKFLLALFNSRLLNFIYHSISQEQGKSQAQVKVKVVRKLPVVVPSEEEQQPIIALVNEILEAKAANPEADTTDKENKIDELLYALYGLTSDEKSLVEKAEN